MGGLGWWFGIKELPLLSYGDPKNPNHQPKPPTRSGSYNCSMYFVIFMTWNIVRNIFFEITISNLMLGYHKQLTWNHTSVNLVDLELIHKRAESWNTFSHFNIATKLRTFVFPFRAFRPTRGSPARRGGRAESKYSKYGWSTGAPNSRNYSRQKGSV